LAAVLFSVLSTQLLSTSTVTIANALFNFFIDD
jgi:hypothetical protein